MSYYGFPYFLTFLFIAFLCVMGLGLFNEFLYDEYKTLLCMEDFEHVYQQCINYGTGEFYDINKIVCHGIFPFTPIDCVELQRMVFPEVLE